MSEKSCDIYILLLPLFVYDFIDTWYTVPLVSYIDVHWDKAMHADDYIIGV